MAEGVQLRVHDPEALANVRAIYGDRLVYCDRPYGALEGADGLAIVTEWQEFRNPDFEVMRRPAARAGDLRRPQSLRRETAHQSGLHLLLDRPLTTAFASLLSPEYRERGEAKVPLASRRATPPSGRAFTPRRA